MDFKVIISQKIASIVQKDAHEIQNLLAIPPQSEMGDFAFPCFLLAKEQKKAPPLMAKELAENLQNLEAFSRIEAAGPYVNFFVDKKIYAKMMCSQISQLIEQKTLSEMGRGQKIVMEYSSPNVAKDFHVGHFLNTMLGGALDRLLRTCSYETVRINHLGDYGTQFGKLVAAYIHWWEPAFEADPFEALKTLYVKFHQEVETHPELEEEARLWFRKLEAQDPQAVSIWTKFKEYTLIKLDGFYKEMNVQFDSFAGESFYIDKMPAVIEELKSKNLLEESEGAQVVRFEDESMPPCIILKRDGSSIYATRDIAAAIYRAKEYNFDHMYYVVGSEQTLHFKQFIKVLEKMGYSWASQITHVRYGLVRLPGKKMSTRKGDVVLMEDLLQEAAERSLAIMNEKNPHLENKEKIARQIAMGALVYTFLKTARDKDVTFSWEDSLSFEGETGPYVQYTNVRCKSILKKAQFVPHTAFDPTLLIHESEQALLKVLSGWVETVESALIKREPCFIIRHITDIAKAFNRFYREVSVMNAETLELQKARLGLVFLVQNVLDKNFELIGIPSVEQM